mgnify:CR=1 FL=1
MSAPIRGDAGIRWTESGQDYLHYLGDKLRKPVTDITQVVHSHESADLTAIRRVSIGSGVEELRAVIRWDGQSDSLRRMIAAGRGGAELEYFPSRASRSGS